jgi:hypothetical protein
MQSTEDDYFDEEIIKYLRWTHDRLAHHLSRAKEAGKIDDAFYRRQNARIMVEKALSVMGHHLP